ncbi:protein fuzzy homolog isoform 1-T1 [Clarias gariepinus]|uniref:protein fuzzy homolog n=1 Tax=Clarias gariepinus TaxID=13013 RepID=UPI00234CC22A|nr:protein fuzzy homolog [Clarias gariepinus]
MSSVPSLLSMLHSQSVQILCLTASSGVPLFSRGSTKQLPFSVIGSLNGVHMFGTGHDATLSCSETERGGRVIWRVFHDSLMLIGVSGNSNISELHLRRLLENVWNCMVLVLGLDELANARNVERLKRELRSCYQLIDMLLERGMDDRDRDLGLMGDLTHCTDCILLPQPDLLQETLESFTKAAESEFGCLLICGKLAVATEKWWRLAPQELVLLSALANLPPGKTSCDYPVFLPQGSPNVALRLLCFQLLPSATACVLCGPRPSLYQLESEQVRRFWSPIVENLRSCLDQAARSALSPSVKLRQDVLGLLLINRESRRSVSSLGYACSKATPPLSITRCWELLRHFYMFAVTHYFTSEEPPCSGGPAPELLHEEFCAGFTHFPVHCYLVNNECKCYAVQTPQHQLFLLIDLSAPTFALRSVATHTLDAIITATGF